MEISLILHFWVISIIYFPVFYFVKPQKSQMLFSWYQAKIWSPGSNFIVDDKTENFG